MCELSTIATLDWIKHYLYPIDNLPGKIVISYNKRRETIDINTVSTTKTIVGRKRLTDNIGYCSIVKLCNFALADAGDKKIILLAKLLKHLDISIDSLPLDTSSLLRLNMEIHCRGC